MTSIPENEHQRREPERAPTRTVEDVLGSAPATSAEWAGIPAGATAETSYPGTGTMAEVVEQMTDVTVDAAVDTVDRHGTSLWIWFRLVLHLVAVAAPVVLVAMFVLPMLPDGAPPMASLVIAAIIVALVVAIGSLHRGFRGWVVAFGTSATDAFIDRARDWWNH